MSRVATSAQDFAVIQAWKNGQAANGTGGPGVGSKWSDKDPKTREPWTGDGSKWRPTHQLNDFRLRTNGRDLYSYSHKIGTTTTDGKKVVFNCSKSYETKNHCLDARTVADFVRVVCPSCHKGDEVANTNTPVAEDQTPFVDSFWNPEKGKMKVFTSWKRGVPCQFKRTLKKGGEVPLKTDGKTIWSFDHIIGETLPDGTKVAYNCRRTNNGKKPSVFALWDTRHIRKVADTQLSNCPTCDPDTAI